MGSTDFLIFAAAVTDRAPQAQSAKGRYSHVSRDLTTF